MNKALLSKRRFIFFMLAPATALLAGLTIFPFLAGVAMSLTNYSMVTPDNLAFAGLSNYVELLQSAEFWKALWVTTLFTVLAVAIELTLGVGIAVLLHHENRFVPTLRAIYLLPMAVTPVAAIFIFRMMLNPSLGIFNYALKTVGLPPQDWLGSPGMAIFSLLIVDTWMWTPFILLIAAGGLAAMDDEPLEAARMDGAGPVALVFHHMLPMLLPYLSIALVFRAIDAFKTFDIIFAMTGGGPGYASETLNIMGFKYSFEYFRMGQSSVILVALFIVVLLCSLGIMKLRASSEN